MTKESARPRRILAPFVLLLAPSAPHMAEEIWSRLGKTGFASHAAYPVADARWLVDDTVEIAVQVNGKVRDRILVPVDLDEAGVRELVLGAEQVKAAIADKEIAKFMYVKGRLVTIAIKG